MAAAIPWQRGFLLELRLLLHSLQAAHPAHVQVPVRVVYLDRSLAPGGGVGGDGNGEVRPADLLWCGCESGILH